MIGLPADLLHFPDHWDVYFYIVLWFGRVQSAGKGWPGLACPGQWQGLLQQGGQLGGGRHDEGVADW